MPKPISMTTRTDEHDKMFTEIEKALDAGWDGYESVRDYSDFLYKEVAYGFLMDSVNRYHARTGKARPPKKEFRTGLLGSK